MPHVPSSFLQAALVFLGSGTGGLLRFWLGGVIQCWWGPTFPIGTMMVNLSGCLAMGFLANAWTGPVFLRDEYRTALLVGVIGGYTTFSMFGRETLALIQGGAWWRAGSYVLGSVVLGLLAVWLGGELSTKLYGPGAS